MYSDISTRIMAFSSPNMASAKRLGQLGLADASRAEEQEGTDRALGVVQADPAAADRVGNCGHRFLLADNAFVERFLHVKQRFRLRSSVSWVTGIPVQPAIISAMLSSPISPVDLSVSLFHVFFACFDFLG